MDIIEKTNQIIAKHKVVANSLAVNPFKEARLNRTFVFENLPEFQGSSEKSAFLQEKYESRIPSGWYGIDLYTVPINWLNALEEFLAELEKDSPDFEIYQLKIKWGGFRGYMGNLSKGAEKAISLLQSAMYDVNLIC